MIEYGEDLFFDPAYKPLFPSLLEELDAVRDRTKGVCMVSYLAHSVEEGDENYLHFVREAMERGLALAHHAAPPPPALGPEYRHVYVFALYPNEMWRVPAYMAVHSVMRNEYGWSAGLEHLDSIILGYDEASIEAWMARGRRLRVDWGGRALYLVMPRSLAEAMVPMAMRCFPPDAALDQVVALFPVEQLEIRPDAGRLVARDAIVARVSASTDLLLSIFGAATEPRTGTLSRRLDAISAPILNQGICSRIEVLGESGWSHQQEQWR